MNKQYTEVDNDKLFRIHMEEESPYTWYCILYNDPVKTFPGPKFNRPT